MFLGLIKNKKLIPASYYKSIFDIDFLSLYQAGFRLILTDLDNTLASYKEKHCSKELIDFIGDVKKMGFEIIIVSNNSKKNRVKIVAEQLEVKWLHMAMKPLKRGYKKALKMASKKYHKKEILTIGDQMLTDIYSSNKMGFYSILVKPVEKKSDVWTTRINRKLELRALKILKKKGLFTEYLEQYQNDSYGGKKYD